MGKPTSIFARLGKQYPNYVAELEAQLHAMRESLAMAEFDLDGYILDANDQYLNLVGYGLDELRGKHHRILVPTQEAQSEEYADFWERLKRGAKFSERVRAVAKNGGEVWLDAAFMPVTRADGHAFKVVKYAKDVTASTLERRALLRASNALDNVTAGVMLTDGDHRIVHTNPALRSMLKAAEADIRKDIPGFSASALMGEAFDIFQVKPEQGSSMMEALQEARRAEITIGGRTMELLAKPLSDTGAFGEGMVIEWQDRTDAIAQQEEIAKSEAEEKQIAADNKRIRDGLDNMSISAMIADRDHNIVYTNRPLDELLRRAESDLRKVLPGFDPRKVMGSKINALIENLTQQSSIIEDLREEYTTLIRVGGRTLELILNPILGGAGTRRGTVVEWREPKDELTVQEEVNALVAAAVAGDFSKRIELDGKEGFFLSLAQGMNELLETSEGAFEDVMKMFSAMAKGDLTKRITTDYSGMFARLKKDANATMDNLTEIVMAISVASEAINVAAGQISVGSTDLSSRTEEQAASLEETASSLEEITATVKQNADNAKQANGQAIDASNVASKGGDLVQQVVTTMGDIDESSKKISEIISVIDGIAFQTNILALNAAVEAARAGEQGRGFAVVAGEVRNLAQRSAASAKEIKQLISDSVAKINSGTELVNRAGTTMDDIVKAVKQVMDNMSEITSASAEQSSGIEQVSQSVTQMDEVTQQNAALVEEASAAARSMVEQTAAMAELVKRFRISEEAARELQRRQAEEAAGAGANAEGAQVATPPIKSYVLANAAGASGASAAVDKAKGDTPAAAVHRANGAGLVGKTNGNAGLPVAAMARNGADGGEQWATF